MNIYFLCLRQNSAELRPQQCQLTMFCGFWPCTKTTLQQRVLKIEFIYLQFVADLQCKTAHGYRRLNSSLHIALNCIYSVCFSCCRRCCCDYYWGRSAWLESKDFRSSGDEGVVLTLMTLKVHIFCYQSCECTRLHSGVSSPSLLWLCVLVCLLTIICILLMMMMIRP